MRIAVLGGGAAGLFAALLLARGGHEVIVLEQDRLPLAPDPEAAAATAFRPAAPQIVQPHMIMGRCRELLIARLPDVYAGLLAAGVAEAPLTAHMPGSLTDRARRKGDERLTTLMTRRSTLDWVLLRAALAEPGVRVHRGVRVRGLLADRGAPPHVTGVRADGGAIPADLVVDATGRRSPVGGWLRQAGAAPPDLRRAECGVAYYSRHFRVRPGAALPGPATTRLLAGLDEFTAGIWGADNGTMQLAVAPLAADRRFASLRDPRTFTAVLGTIPAFRGWLAGLDPITDVFVMGGLHNTLRRLVAGGRPVATGLHAIGDSVCTTNPTLGRGLSLAISGAADLADIVAAYGRNGIDQALAMDALVAAHVLPYYEDQAALDAGRLAALRHAVFGEPAPPPAILTGARVTHAQLRTAAAVDPVAFRGLWAILAMARLPEEVYGDSRVVAATREALRQHGGALRPAQPEARELQLALAGV